MNNYFSIAMAAVKGLDILKKWFLPYKEHEEILQSTRELSTQIDKVKDDIHDLEEMIKLEMTDLKYSDNVERIKLGMQYCLEIGQGGGMITSWYHQRKLKSLCANENCTLTLNAFLNGMTGNGPFRKSILDDSYNTTKGDLPKISALANRLEQLVCGGVIVLATYETMMFGEEGSKARTEQYGSRLKDVDAKIQSVLDRCVKNFRESMLNDLNAFLDKGGSNEELVTKISDFMTRKYDWLENFCLVYNDLDGFDKHCFGGHRVSSLHRNGKCGIVFYRTKSEPPRFSDRYKEAKKIVGDDSCGIGWFGRHNADNCYDDIVAKMKARGIGWTGCAVIKRHADLWSDGTFSTKRAFVVGEKHTAILLLE